MTLRCFSEVFYHLHNKNNSYNDNCPIRRGIRNDSWLKKLMAHFNKISFIQVAVWSSSWRDFKGGRKEEEVLRINSDSSRKTQMSNLKCCIWQKEGIQFCFIFNERKDISMFFLGIGSSHGSKTLCKGSDNYYGKITQGIKKWTQYSNKTNTQKFIDATNEKIKWVSTSSVSCEVNMIVSLIS